MPREIDLNEIIGNKYGKLTVKKYSETKYFGKNREHYYFCDCDCGTKNFVTTRHNLLRGDVKSCGCAKKDAGKRRLNDLTGQKIGRWTVLKRAPNRVSKSGKTRSVMWTCKCECGTVKDVGARALKLKTSLSCGCLQKERVSEALTDDLIGQRFCNLLVIERDGSHCSSKDKKSNFNAKWKCLCDCGNEVSVLGFSLKNGDTTSCGCKKQSKYELYVEIYLQKCGYILDVDYFKEKTFPNLLGFNGGSLRYDFYLITKTNEKVLIECQGKQHYKPVDWYGGDNYYKTLKFNDKLKKEFAKNNNFKFIEIHYKNFLYEDVVYLLQNNDIC